MPEPPTWLACSHGMARSVEFPRGQELRTKLGGLKVLVLAAADRASALCRFLSRSSAVTSLHCASEHKVARARSAPAFATPAQLRDFVRRKRIELVVVGPSGEELGQGLRQGCRPVALRGRSSLVPGLNEFLRHQPGSWRVLRRKRDQPRWPEPAPKGTSSSLSSVPRERGPVRVLVAGFGPSDERAWAAFLARHPAVGWIYLCPGRAGAGSHLATRLSEDPADVGALAHAAQRRRVDLTIEGPASAGLVELLRRRGFEALRADEPDEFLRDVWTWTRTGRRPARPAFALAPPRAAPHPRFLPARFECERDRAYVFRLQPPEEPHGL